MCSVSVFLWFFVWTPVTIRGIIGWQNDSSSHCTALHCSSLHCTALHWRRQKCTPIHCTSLLVHLTALQYTTLYCNKLNCTVIHSILLHYNELRCTTLNYPAIHCTSKHCTGSWSLFVTKSSEFPDNYRVTPHIRSHQANKTTEESPNSNWIFTKHSFIYLACIIST